MMGQESPRMPLLTVLIPGFLTTAQDLGRFHFAHLGISASGAADTVSFRLGNLLVGNPPEMPALEMTLVGATFRVESPSVLALTGAAFGAQLDGHPVAPWETFSVHPGQVLQCGATQSGARCYLCARGGIDVPQILGSASTHVLNSMGGLQGGRLQSKHVIYAAPQRSAQKEMHRRVKSAVLERLFRPGSLRVTDGPQAGDFPEDVRSLFFSAEYTVKEESDRMGLRLSGPPLQCSTREGLVTEGVSVGAIQVPPDQQPILLFVEHPTTGGYPKIANVISADLHRVGQLRPRDHVRFEHVRHESAMALLSEREGLLLPQNCLQ